MKSHSTLRHISLFFFTAFLLIQTNLAAQDIYGLAGDFSIQISGTSNVHDWEETASKATGQARIQWNTDGSFNVLALDLNIDVKSIKSTKGSIMDNKTYEALKADDNPTIVFKITSVLSNVKPGATISARGDLKIAGVSKPVDLQVKVGGNNTTLVFEGAKKINMKEWNVSPPTAFMGAMKVGESVDLKFKSSYTKK